MMRLSVLAVVIFCTFQTGCGGGGGSGGDGILSGSFLDGPFIGLRYETESLEGVTDAQGRFLFRAGEGIRFHLGNTLLGTTDAGHSITIFSLRGIEPPLGKELIARKLSTPRDEINTVGNILQVLHTFDTDGDSSNGFAFAPDVISYLESVSLTLAGDTRSFRTYRPYRHALKTFNDAGLFPDHRTIRQPWLVMHEEYQRLGIPLGAAQLPVTTTDQSGDGVIDSILYATFNPLGFETTHEQDSNADGTIDLVRTSLLDTSFNIIRLENDDDVDGVPDSITLRDYDRDNNYVHSQSDSNGDGVTDGHIWRSYNDYGQLTSIGWDNNADSVIDARRNYVYDTRGLLVRREHDRMADGVIDVTTTYEYNSKGLVTRIENDRDGDGVIDTVTTHAYDANGNDVLTAHDGTDGPRDGVVDRREQREFDAANRETLYTVDTNADGSIDRNEIRVYDAQGNQVRYDRFSAGVLTRSEVHTYDEHNWLIKRENFNNAGVRTFADYYEYDAHGARTRYTQDRFGAGDIWTLDTNSGAHVSSWWSMLRDL